MPSSNDASTSNNRQESGSEIDDQLSELIDDPDFLRIEGRFGSFNIFDSLGAVRGELRHSNLLAFLLSPSRRHGLGSSFLEQVLRHLLGKLPREARPLRPLEIAIGDLENAVVHRERDGIDLLVEIREINLVVLIENKIFSKAGEGQLARYKALVDRKYPRWRHLLVLLTPDGREPGEDDYIALSYVEIARLLDGLIQSRITSVSDDVVMIVTHYVEMLRRHIVPDEELRALALKVYDRHKEAIDFIIEALPEQDTQNASIRNLIAESDSLDLDNPAASRIRFFPTAWSAIPQFNCCPLTKWTRTGRNLLFEVKFQRNDTTGTQRIGLALILGPSNQELREYVFSEAQKNPRTFVGCRKSLGEKHVTIFTRELLSRAESMDCDPEQQIEILTERWHDFLDRDLDDLMRSLEDIASNAPNVSISAKS